MHKPTRPILSAVRSAAAPVAVPTAPVSAGPEGSAGISTPYIRASIETASVVEENGFLIVPVVFGTETPVRRYNYRYNDYEGEYFDEVLSCAPEHIHLARLSETGPVLDGHDQYGSVTRVVLGKVVKGSVHVTGAEGHARLRMSNRPELASLRQDIKDGIVTSISVGYDVHTFVREESLDTNAVPVYRATSWEPKEISFVPVPADINSGVRAAGSTPPENLIYIPMKYGTRANGPQRNAAATSGEPSGGGAAAPATPQAAAPAAAAPAEPAPAEPAARAAAPAAAPVAAPTGATAERARVLGIQSAVRTLGLPDTSATAYIEAGISVEAATVRALSEWAAGDPTRNLSGSNGGASVNTRGNNERASEFARMAEAAILQRAGRGSLLTDAERTGLRSMHDFSLLDLGRRSLEIHGVNMDGLSRRQIAQAAVTGSFRSLGGMHTTTDFPMLLTSTLNRTLLAEYNETPNTFDPWISRGTLNDFRTTNRVRMTDLLKDFAKVQEGGEYTYNTFDESGEGVSLGKYGTIIGLSWESVINDDLNAFSRLPRGAARKSRKLQGDLVYGILTGNPKLADGNNLFSAAHKNLSTTGANLSIASMSAAKTAMRKQVAPGEKAGSTQYLNIQPKFLIVGPDMETEAEQFINGIYVPQTQDAANIFRGKLQIIVEGRITDRSWYLVAAPGEIDTVELNFLSGEPELFTEERYGFDRDSYELKVRTVTGAAAIDHRGMYKNTGGNAPA